MYKRQGVDTEGSGFLEMGQRSVYMMGVDTEESSFLGMGQLSLYMRKGLVPRKVASWEWDSCLFT